MKLLETNRRCLIWLRIMPADESTNRWQRLAHTVFAVVIVMGLIFGVAASWVFCWKSVSIDVGLTIYAFAITVGEFVAIYTALVGMILLRHKIGTIFENLGTIYKNNEDSDSFRFLARANKTSERMWKIYFKIMAAMHINNFVVAPLISVLFNWAINKNFNVENYFNPILQALPWNQTTPLGYVGELTFSCLYAFGYWFINGSFLLLFISICVHHYAFYKMFKHSVNKLTRPDQCDAKFLCDLMRFHLSVKDWFLHTADVYSSLNVIHLFCNEMVLAISIFYVDYQFQQDSINIMAFTIMAMALSNLFIYCYLGKVATEIYAKMSDCVYDKIKWYEVSPGLQKYFILMIQNMQQSLHYHGFGVIYLNLETFTKLVKSAISYYMSINAIATE